MTTYDEAIDTMYGVFFAAWASGAAAIVGYAPEVDYDDEATGERAKLDKAFARLNIVNGDEGQIGMGAARLFETDGILVVQIFVPRKDDAGVVKVRALAVMVRDAYRSAGVGGAVWFSNASVKEQPVDARWRQVNVNVDYDFTETI